MVDSAMTLDTLLKIGEIMSIIGGGGLVAFKLGRTTTRVENAIALQSATMEKTAKEIETLKDEIKVLSKLVTEVAVQNQRLDTQDRRLDAHERTIEDLRRGEGFIYPLGSHLKATPPR